MAKTKQAKKPARATAAAPAPRAEASVHSITLQAIRDIPKTGIHKEDRVTIVATGSGEVTSVFLSRALALDPKPLVAATIAHSLVPACTFGQLEEVSLQLANLRRAP